MTYSRLTQLVETSIRYWVITEEKRREEVMPVSVQTLRDFSDAESSSERKMIPCNAIHCPICDASGVVKKASPVFIP